MTSCQSWQTYPSQWSTETLNKLINECKKTSDISALQMNSEPERKRVFGEEPDWEGSSGKLSCRGEGGPEILCGGESKALPPCSRWHHRAIPFWCSISNNRHLLNPRKEGLLRSSGPGLRSSQRRLSAALKQQRILKSARTGRGGAISLPSTLLKIARHECQSWTHPALLLAGVVLSNFPSWTGCDFSLS